jgi:methionine synthase II (cobalamin-independent)
MGARLGNCSTTGIGSLPFQEPDEAIELVFESCDVPYWPQLKGESMYDQFSFPLPREEELIQFYEDLIHEREERFVYPRELFRGLYRLAEWVGSKRLDIVKGQITGPITLGYYLKDVGGKALILDEKWREIIVKAITAEAKWQEKFLRSFANEVVIFLDEPLLAISGTPQFSLAPGECDSLLEEVFSGMGCVRGIHCCGNTDWERILSLPIQIVSFDAYNYGRNFVAYRKEIGDFVDRGGTVAWGITPSTQDIEDEDVSSLCTKLLGIVGGLDILESSMITPSCGLSSLSPVQATTASKMTRELSRMLKNRSESSRG